MRFSAFLYSSRAGLESVVVVVVVVVVLIFGSDKSCVGDRQSFRFGHWYFIFD